MKKEDIKVIKIKENYGDTCLKDSRGIKEIVSRKPEGYVEIYDILPDGSKQLVGKSNLVLYTGREWIAERLFNVENASTTQDKDEFICWLGVGDGGAPPGDPLNPTAPTSLDTGLANEVHVNDTDTNCTDYRGAPDDSYFKKPLDSVEFEQDPGNSNKYLITKVTVTIGANDCNGENLNEAALFTCQSSAGGVGNTGPWNIFSRVTFATIAKTSTRQLMLIWYIYV